MAQGKYDALAAAENSRVERDLRRNALDFAMKITSVDTSSKKIITDAEAYLKFLRGKK